MKKSIIAALAVLVLGIVVWLVIWPDGRQTGPAAPMTAFDPLVRTIAIDDDADYEAYAHSTSRTKQTLLLKVRGNSDSVGSLTVWATGAAPVPTGEAMPDVNGNRALWTGEAVAWEWVPGSWAFVDLVEFDREREDSHLIAQHVTFDHRDLTDFPYTVQTSWPLEEVLTGDGGKLFTITFENGVELRYFDGKPTASSKTVPPEELRALESAVRPANPAVSNPLR